MEPKKLTKTDYLKIGAMALLAVVGAEIASRTICGTEYLLPEVAKQSFAAMRQSPSQLGL